VLWMVWVFAIYSWILTKSSELMRSGLIGMTIVKFGVSYSFFRHLNIRKENFDRRLTVYGVMTS